MRRPRPRELLGRLAHGQRGTARNGRATGAGPGQAGGDAFTAFTAFTPFTEAYRDEALKHPGHTGAAYLAAGPGSGRARLRGRPVRPPRLPRARPRWPAGRWPGHVAGRGGRLDPLPKGPTPGPGSPPGKRNGLADRARHSDRGEQQEQHSRHNPVSGLRVHPMRLGPVRRIRPTRVSGTVSLLPSGVWCVQLQGGGLRHRGASVMDDNAEGVPPARAERSEFEGGGVRARPRDPRHDPPGRR